MGPETQNTAPGLHATGMLKQTSTLQRHVAIVDDDDDDMMRLRHELSFLFGTAPVLSFSSGMELVHYLDTHVKASERPYIIFLDLHMNGMDGLATLEYLQGRLNMSDIAIIMVSGTQDMEHVRIALENGAQAFLPKPVSRWDMIRLLQGKCLQENRQNNR